MPSPASETTPAAKSWYPALTEPNFRLYFAGLVLSALGTWVQNTAQAQFVALKSRDPFSVALVYSLMTIPVAVFAPFGGIVVDRFKTRNVLYVTQTLSMLQAFTMAVLVIGGWATVMEIYILAASLGLINAIDMPARRAFITEIITDKGKMISASAMNAVVITTSQMIGPVIAGIIMKFVGIGPTFIINGISFIAVIVAMWKIRILKAHVASNESFRKMFKSGMRYTFIEEKRLRLCIVLGGIASAAGGIASRTILPVVAKNYFNADPLVVGFFIGAIGLGTIIGSSFVSRHHKSELRTFIIRGSLISGSALCLFWFIAPSYAGQKMSSRFGVELILLALAGVGFTSSLSALSSFTIAILKDLGKEGMVARVTGFQIMMFFGGMSIGQVISGWLAHLLGPITAIGINGISALTLGITLWCVRERLIIDMPERRPARK